MANKPSNVVASQDDSGWEVKVEPFSPTWDFERNPVLIGQFVNHRTTEQDDLNNPGQTREANVYEIVEATNGEKYTVWGSYAIDEAFADIAPGTIVRITFEGKVEIKGGRSVNQFRVETKK